jgi:hypothetical protein
MRISCFRQESLLLQARSSARVPDFRRFPFTRIASGAVMKTPSRQGSKGRVYSVDCHVLQLVKPMRQQT